MVSERLLSSWSRVVLLTLSCALFLVAGMVFRKSNIPVFVILLIAGTICNILVNRHYNSTNEALSYLFDSLRNDDTTVRFREETGNKTLSRVYENINNLNEHFQEIKLRNEYNESYYKTIIQHASAGLLILGKDNRLELINRTACSYAGISPESTNNDLLRIKRPEFFKAVSDLKPGEAHTYKNLISGNLQLLLFRASLIKKKDEELKLVSIQDIRNELESKEIESYRKLLSVLTHEIMNHLSPLTSVARELHTLLSSGETNQGERQIDTSTLKTTISGLRLINEQSDGLVNFMNNYRKISKIPKPEFVSFPVEEWVDQLRIAFYGKMNENGIDFSISHDKSVREIIADRKLLNQVMVNLINNAFDAVMENKEEKKIEIHIGKNHIGRIMVRVTNNGPVIPAELIERIFIPFFTTKQNGSGIGLGISQEIMKMHNGSLVAISSEESKTSFIIEF